MPSQCGPSSHCEYLNTLGEIEGFQQFDNIVLVGDFNVGVPVHCFRVVQHPRTSSNV